MNGRNKRGQGMHESALAVTGLGGASRSRTYAGARLLGGGKGVARAGARSLTRLSQACDQLWTSRAGRISTMGLGGARLSASRAS